MSPTKLAGGEINNDFLVQQSLLNFNKENYFKKLRHQIGCLWHLIIAFPNLFLDFNG